MMKKVLILLGIVIAAMVALLSIHRSLVCAVTPFAEMTSAYQEPDAISSQRTMGETSVITPGVLTFHEADPTIAYNWFTYVPHGMSHTQPNYILMTGLHGQSTSGDYDEMTQWSQRMAERSIHWAEEYGYILLVPVVPRGTPPGSNHLYPVAFDLDCFLGSTDPFYQRPDLKINLMIDQLISDLQSSGYNVHEKVLIMGFSAGGMFAQRYTLLHPERVQAIAAGHCGGTIVLPESQYGGAGGIPMDWAVGVNNFSSLVGYDFDQST